MDKTNLLLEKNKTSNRKIKIKNGKAVFWYRDEWFSGETIGKIIEFVNTLHRQYPRIKVPIIFDLGTITFIDKLTYVLFECICYSLIVNYKHEVQIFCNVIKDIWTEGIRSSPLLLLNGTSLKSIKKYPHKFDKDTYGYHLRRVVKINKNEDTNYLGNIYQEIDSFLKPFGVDEECSNEISKVIVELVGNACEHADSDCLIDVDVSKGYNKTVENITDENYYYGINIVVLNFSQVLLGDDIRKKVDSNLECSGRYKKVIDAYKYHKYHFNENYQEDDFYNITAFQHKISGRYDCDSTGGTGLTQLIKSLGERSDAHSCYVISGDRSINFYQEILEFNSDKWIGFNRKKDYISGIPEKNVISECLVYMPGTAYNLNFIMKGEKING